MMIIICRVQSCLSHRLIRMAAWQSYTHVVSAASCTFGLRLEGTRAWHEASNVSSHTRTGTRDVSMPRLPQTCARLPALVSRTPLWGRAHHSHTSATAMQAGQMSMEARGQQTPVTSHSEASSACLLAPLAVCYEPVSVRQTTFCSKDWTETLS